MSTSSAETIPDGPLDITYDISQLSQETQERRREQYQRYALQGGELLTASGAVIPFDLGTDAVGTSWIVDEHVSVATIACDLCSQINACRPPGTPPFVCLVRARPRAIRDDGTSVCGLCKVVRRQKNGSKQCKAKGGRMPEYYRLGLKIGGIRSKKFERRNRKNCNDAGGEGDDGESLFDGELSDCDDSSVEDDDKEECQHGSAEGSKSRKRLSNWNKAAFVDESLHNKRTSAVTPTNDPHWQSTNQSSQCHAAFSNQQPLHPIRSHVEDEFTAQDGARRSVAAVPAGSTSEEESVDVPLSSYVFSRQSFLESNDNCMEGANTAQRMDDSKMGEAHKQQEDLLKILEIGNKNSLQKVENLMSGQAKLKKIVESGRGDVSKGEQSEEIKDTNACSLGEMKRRVDCIDRDYLEKKDELKKMEKDRERLRKQYHDMLLSEQKKYSKYTTSGPQFN